MHASGISLPVENVGTVMGVTGLNAAYIVVRLPDGLPAGDLPLTIAVDGIVNTNSVTLGHFTVILFLFAFSFTFELVSFRFQLRLSYIFLVIGLARYSSLRLAACASRPNTV